MIHLDIDNSFLMNMIPDTIDRYVGDIAMIYLTSNIHSCKDNYPKDHGYRRQIKQYWNRWAAFVCFQGLSEACQQVMIEDITSVAMSGSAPETEYATTEDAPLR